MARVRLSRVALSALYTLARRTRGASTAAVIMLSRSRKLRVFVSIINNN